MVTMDSYYWTHMHSSYAISSELGPNDPNYLKLAQFQHFASPIVLCNC